jgi:hypothetical protein
MSKRLAKLGRICLHFCIARFLRIFDQSIGKPPRIIFSL